MKTETLQKLKACFEHNVKHGELQLNTLSFPVRQAKESVESNIIMNQTAADIIGQEIQAKRLGIELHV